MKMEKMLLKSEAGEIIAYKNHSGAILAGYSSDRIKLLLEEASLSKFRGTEGLRTQCC